MNQPSGRKTPRKKKKEMRNLWPANLSTEALFLSSHFPDPLSLSLLSEGKTKKVGGEEGIPAEVRLHRIDRAERPKFGEINIYLYSIWASEQWDTLRAIFLSTINDWLRWRTTRLSAAMDET